MPVTHRHASKRGHLALAEIALMAKQILLSMLLSATLSAGLVAGCSGGEETPDAEATPDDERLHGLTKVQAAELLVKVGDTEITVGEFAQRLSDQSPYLRARYNSPERRREFLENMIRFELLAAEAERRGMDELPEVARTRKQVMIQQMMKARFEDRIQLSDITDEEIRTYYEANASEFNKPEQVRASHIVFMERGAAQRVLGQILAAPEDVSLFRRLAEQHNADEGTRQRFGDLRFFGRPGDGGDEDGRVPASVATAAFAIERIGGVHGSLVEHEGRFHVIKLTGRRAALHRSIDEARRPIQNRLWREKRETAVNDFVAGLRRDANVEENLAALDSVRIQIPTGNSPTVDVQPPEAPGATPVPAGGH